MIICPSKLTTMIVLCTCAFLPVHNALIFILLFLILLFYFDSLPLAFIGMHAGESTTKKAWSEVWSDNTGGDNAGLRLYTKEVAGLVLHLLSQREWPLKKQACRKGMHLCVVL